MQVNVMNSGKLWFAPALFGGVLIALGVLIYIFPQILAYAVGSLFIVVGVSMLGLALNVRKRVTIRRVDEAWSDGPRPPTGAFPDERP